ncbi:MAG: methylated-DNA--[protein]-cysteine S-methyltransferase [Dysgonamonadaceae bacterium]|jgi:methylated-DNA-[protein]-cysteine S-methyltransferase|nr:methylated-DNA--[protein]-cysteine S-methyltransferase [Dysgonamonadaceae bacterium]
MDTGYYHSPVGILEIKADDKAIISVQLCDKIAWRTKSKNPIIRQSIIQLSEYFAGKRRSFDLPLFAKGTEFQEKVWDALLQLPYGKTVSYAEVAKIVRHPKAWRAVGSANGKNPIAIIIPCHRVIASDGTLGGYAHGLDIKKQLLDLEKQNK